MKQVPHSRSSLVMALGLIAVFLFSGHLYQIIVHDLIPRLSDNDRYAQTHVYPNFQIHLDPVTVPRLHVESRLAARAIGNAHIWTSKSWCKDHWISSPGLHPAPHAPTFNIRQIQADVDRLEAELKAEGSSLENLERKLRVQIPSGQAPSVNVTVRSSSNGDAS